MSEFTIWKSKIEDISNSLLKKPVMLEQFSRWLEASEANTKYQGKDIIDMLQGAMIYLSSVEFIPGIEHRNLAAVLQNIQEKTELDLGLCEYLQGDIIEVERKSRELKPAYCTCVFSGASIADLSCCLSPNRNHCSHYQKAKSESF